MNINNLSPQQSLQLFLMCSVAYYHRFESLIEDHEYDKLAKNLLNTWDEWQTHQHAYLVTKDNLTTGSMYNIKYKDYPDMILVATDMKLRDSYALKGGVVG